MVTDTLYEPYVDEKYKIFASSLSPTGTLERKGIRIPLLRKLSRTVNSDDIEIRYHEDVILRGLAIGKERRLDKLTLLLPFLSSWDQTDTIGPAFKPEESERDRYYSYFTSLLSSREVFPKRLAVVWLMTNRKLFERKTVTDLIIKADEENEYYISMAVAWALSALIIDDRTLLPRLEEVSGQTKKRTEQKLRDSFRFNPRR